MSKDYIKQEPSELDENLFEKMRELIYSEKTAEKISDICTKYNVYDEKKVEQIGYWVGLSLLGKLAPKELTKSFVENIKLSPKVAENIYFELNQTIFSYIKNDLAKLYDIKKKEENLPLPEEKPKEEPKKSSGKETTEINTKKPHFKDIYHEPIE